MCSVTNMGMRHMFRKGKVDERAWRSVASHSDIHVRARGWCDNGGVSVKDGKWQLPSIEKHHLYICFGSFQLKILKADCLPMRQI